MSEINPHFSKDEFHAYLLFYCANADFVEQEEEMEFIKSKTENEVFEKMHKQFQKDNDFQRIQKIERTLDALEYTKEQKELLLEEIQALFMSDGKFPILERNAYLGLKHIFGV